jgi:hypothetical protein
LCLAKIKTAKRSNSSTTNHSRLRREENVYLDIVEIIEAVKEPSAPLARRIG